MRPQNKSRSRNKNSSSSNINSNNRRQMGNVVNRVFDSSGPEGKVRGTPQQIIEKYQGLARDAQLSNDRVAAENFLQHSEHYSRMLNEALSQQAETRQSGDGQQGERPNGYEGEGGAESLGQAYGQQQPQQQSYEAQPQPAYLPQPAYQPQPQPEMAAFQPVDEGEPHTLVQTPENPQSAGRSRSRGGQSRGRKPAVQNESASEPAADMPVAD